MGGVYTFVASGVDKAAQPMSIATVGDVMAGAIDA
jgi:hypothetical protein